MRNKVLSFFFVLLFSISLCITAYANDNVEGSGSRVLLSSEKVNIAGTTVVTNTYYDQGFRVTTYKFVDQSISEQQMNQAAKLIMSGSLCAEEKAVSRISDPVVNGTEPFSSSNRSTTLIGYEVGQSGTFYSGSGDSYSYLWVGAGSTSYVGYVHPEETPDSIIIHQTLTTTGTGVSWSWPPSINATEKTETYVLGPYTHVNVMRAEWDVGGASTRLPINFTLTASTRGDIQFKDKTYALSTSNTYSYY